MKSLSILQDANSGAAVATYTMDKDSIVDISIKIKNLFEKKSQWN